MPDQLNLAIPRALLPGDGRFGSGPSKVRQGAVRELAAEGHSYLGTSHRQPPVEAVVAGLRNGLRRLFSLPDGYEVVLGIGGATQFWEVGAFSLIDRRSQHLVCGEFSAKFAAVARGAPHLEDPIVVSAEPGSAPTPDPSADVDVFALIHNETSTGVMLPIARPRRDESLVVVDGTSAAGGLPIDPVAFDAYYFSPQKAFGSDGGLWAALCSPAAVERAARIAATRWIPPMSDLSRAIANARNNQTYNTPALATLYLWLRQLEWIESMGGLAWAIERCAASSGILYSWAERSEFAWPFVPEREHRSATVATIDLRDDVSANQVSAILRANGVVDTESYRKLGRNQMRIATFPNIDPDDVERLTASIDYVVARL